MPSCIYLFLTGALRWSYFRIAAKTERKTLRFSTGHGNLRSNIWIRRLAALNTPACAGWRFQLGRKQTVLALE
jgi:hypothetical protein